MNTIQEDDNRCEYLECGSEYSCSELFNGCDCGDYGCGDPYCFSCNACDCCKENQI